MMRRHDADGSIEAVRLVLGGVVRCTDLVFGELADIVVDPVSRRVTHLVVQPHRRHDQARLVPVERASAEGDELVLDCSVADVEALAPVHASAYVRVGQLPVADPDWEIGTTDVLALPVYRELDGMGTVVDPDPHVVVNYDRIPKHEVEVRRSSAVVSSDGHHLGHVDGFLVGSGETAGIVLERGHLWGRREIVIPATVIARVETDQVTLSVTKDEVGLFEARRVHRWF
jgi:sporulation protein YlmC with PRC-barrel domain